MWLFDLARSFRYAFRGLYRVAREERNLRIHLTAVVYVSAAGWLAELDAPHWGVVLLCFAAVLTSELLNTALEHICDTVHPQRAPGIGAAKDAAAGAVLVFALASVCIAVGVFGPWIMGGGLWAAQAKYPWLLPVFLVSLIPAGWFIAMPAHGVPPAKKG